MAGRRPVPDAIKDLTGSHNARNPRSPRFRKLEAVTVLKDVEREPRALEIWNDTVPELVELGLLTYANRRVWGNYCLAYADACAAQDDVFENGRWIEHSIFNNKGEETGTVKKPNPAIRQARDARLEMKCYAVEFGVTPAAATRVQTATGDEAAKDDFSKFTGPVEEDSDIDDSVRPN